MKKIIINENQKGLMFKKGKFVRPLGAGVYYQHGNTSIEVLDINAAITSHTISQNMLLSNPEMKKQTIVTEVAPDRLALHYVNGIFRDLLQPGKYAFWLSAENHSFVITDASTPEIGEEVPRNVLPLISDQQVLRFTVCEHMLGRLCFDHRFIRILEPGTYYFWRTATAVHVTCTDTRLTQLEIAGQELLTADKVTLRISLVCVYRITDCVRLMTEIDDFEGQLRTAAQLCLREYVGRCRLDELLEGRDGLSEYIFDCLRKKAPELQLEISSAGVRDIILPGEIRSILNSVLTAEKRAQANVITRREEVASTRSLLNTAKMMEENPTLYRLKELEYAERICENVGNITLNGSGDLLTQLTNLLHDHSVDVR